MLEDPNHRECYYHAALIHAKKISFGTKAQDRKLTELLKKHGTFESIWKAKSDMFSDQDSELEKTANKIEKHQFEVITINDARYPDSLRTVVDATPVLYVQGDTGLFEKKTIAVVGTRELEDKADLDAAKDIMKRLLQKKYCIVSGLAEGCDTYGHNAAINNDGRTIAVLGTPLSSYYPKENKELQQKIAREQLCVSQYPIGVKTFPSHFAHRNKTTAGLATEGVVIIRAGDKSGTQHAIKECVAHDKPLFVLHNNFLQGYDWPEKYLQKIREKHGDDTKKYFRIPNLPEEDT